MGSGWSYANPAMVLGAVKKPPQLSHTHFNTILAWLIAWTVGTVYTGSGGRV